VIVTNTNVNDSSGGSLDNANVEENDKINDNTQRPTTERSQTNSSSQ
jgi:hypothetical protein